MCWVNLSKLQEFNNQRLFCFDIHSKTHHGKHLLDSQQDEYQFIAWDKSNHLILHSPGAPAIALPKKEGFSTLDNQHQGWRLYTTHDRISGLGNRYFLIHPKPGTIWPSILQ
ncbi:MAG: hypothetical protein GY782_07120 [Gammaproteobacteria bacterium]|nr:hypothetical protein [Gammaproteobacteria bacterium]